MFEASPHPAAGRSPAGARRIRRRAPDRDAVALGERRIGPARRLRNGSLPRAPVLRAQNRAGPPG